jgi:hypothetical protein
MCVISYHYWWWLDSIVNRELTEMISSAFDDASIVIIATNFNSITWPNIIVIIIVDTLRQVSSAIIELFDIVTLYLEFHDDREARISSARVSWIKLHFFNIVISIICIDIEYSWNRSWVILWLHEGCLQCLNLITLW